MMEATKSFALYQTTPTQIRVDSSQGVYRYHFFKIGHNQWILYCANKKQPIAIITVSRLKSSVFWCSRTLWNYAKRDMGLANDILTYAIDPRRKLRWSRSNRTLSIYDGSTVWPMSASIEHVQQDNLHSATVKVATTSYEVEILVSAFITMIIWNDKSFLARVRTEIDERAKLLGRQVWGRLIQFNR